MVVAKAELAQSYRHQPRRSFFLPDKDMNQIVPLLKSLVPYNGNMKYSYRLIHFTHMWGTGKSEIRISKLETNTNDKNINDQNEKWSYHEVFV